MDTFLKDVRYGCRTLLRNPGFTAVAVLSLALGIGANTAVFSFIDTILLRTLPVQNPKELVLLGAGKRARQFQRACEGRGRAVLVAGIPGYPPESKRICGYSGCR